MIVRFALIWSACMAIAFAVLAVLTVARMSFATRAIRGAVLAAALISIPLLPALLAGIGVLSLPPIARAIARRRFYAALGRI